jgi:hypothetical protein
VAMSYANTIQIQQPTHVIQALLAELYAPGDNPAVRDREVRPFGLTALQVDKDQVIRWDFDIRPGDGGSELQLALTYVEGQSATSWLMLRPFLKRMTRKQLEEIKRLAEQSG